MNTSSYVLKYFYSNRNLLYTLPQLFSAQPRDVGHSDLLVYISVVCNVPKAFQKVNFCMKVTQILNNVDVNDIPLTMLNTFFKYLSIFERI